MDMLFIEFKLKATAIRRICHCGGMKVLKARVAFMLDNNFPEFTWRIMDNTGKWCAGNTTNDIQGDASFQGYLYQPE